jgi:hypothetical protein
MELRRVGVRVEENAVDTWAWLFEELQERGGALTVHFLCMDRVHKIVAKVVLVGTDTIEAREYDEGGTLKRTYVFHKRDAELENWPYLSMILDTVTFPLS